MRKIAIFAPRQSGDVLSASAVLRYKNELWGTAAKIVWFIADENRDLFRYNPEIELRHFAHGWQISEHDKATVYAERIAKDKAEGKPEWGDWSLLRTPDNKMSTSLQSLFPELSDISVGYFPLPWMLDGAQRSATNYPNCSKKIFGVPMDRSWHPVLYHSDDERRAAAEFVGNLPPRKKTIIIESFCGSGQSKITHEMIQETMRVCGREWGPCNFIFVSHKYLNGQPQFPDEFFTDSIVSAAHFTVRQCALLANFCDLFISTSSGVTVASSCWGARPYGMLQYCGSPICGTKELAIGECVQVFTDDNPQSEQHYFEQLNYLLTKYK